jgi:hypothetical protein
MNTKIDLFVGAPIEYESERRFLRRLRADLESRGEDAIIFANMLLPKRNPLRQVDFLLILRHCVCHIEHKNLTSPVVGAFNGYWSILQPDGSPKSLEANPYRQALDCKYSISDEMLDFAAGRKGLPKLASGEKYFSQIESVVCISPSLLPGSKTPDDRKVHVKGYPEFLQFVTSVRRSPGWTRDDWIAFAVELGLVHQADCGAESICRLMDSQAIVDGYCRRFQEFYRNGLPPLVSSRVEHGGETKRSEAILGFLELGQHGQLIGGSGMGKSHHALHMALAALDAGRIAIVARARDYSGRLSSLLDRSIAHLCAQSAMRFVEHAKKLERPLVLVLDGFNECPAQLKQELLKNLQAFYLRFAIPVFVTSQEEIALPKELTGAVLRLCDLDDDERLAILRSHAGGTLPSNARDLCRPFRSAYELSLAASCLGEISGPPNRTALFETYFRRSCANVVTAAILRKVLVALADDMRRGLTSALSVSETWRIAERVLDEEMAPASMLKDVVGSPLLSIRHDRCAFRHELHQRFFESLSLARASRDTNHLIEELRKPNHHDLIEFLLGTQTDEATIRKLLEVSVPTKAATHLFTDCLDGHFGTLHQNVVSQELSRVLNLAERDLEQARINIEEDPQGREPFKIDITNTRRWSAYDLRLVDQLAAILRDGMFFEQTMNLIRDTENRCIELLSELLGKDLSEKRSTRSILFWHVFIGGPNSGRLPGAAIVAGYQGHFRETTRPETQAHVIELLRRPEDLSNAEIYLYFSLLGWEAESFQDIIPSLLEHCWRTGVYHLILVALERVRGWARSVSDPVSERIKGLLSGFHSSNIFLSTTIIEAMCAYGMVESPVDNAEACREIAEILSSPDSAEANEAAYGVISKIFEDVFEGVYYDAIEQLSPDERSRLYTMAALGAPRGAFDVGWILARLIETGSEGSLPAFLRFTTGLDDDSMFPQEVAAQFVLAHVGCAKYLQMPVRLADVTTDDRRAWQYYGEILFWLHKPGLTPAEVKHRCDPLWDSLESQVPFEAIDPLCRFAHAMLTDVTREHHPVQRLFAGSRERIRRILAYGLKNRERLSGIDKRVPPEAACRERTTFIIHTLGQIGAESDIKLLQALVDDDYHGIDAVEAIRRLRESVPFEGLSVLHRFP